MSLAGVLQVIVATDDPRIAEVCTAAGAEVVMTRDTCPNGACTAPLQPMHAARSSRHAHVSCLALRQSRDFSQICTTPGKPRKAKQDLPVVACRHRAV